MSPELIHYIQVSEMLPCTSHSSVEKCTPDKRGLDALPIVANSICSQDIPEKSKRFWFVKYIIEFLRHQTDIEGEIFEQIIKSNRI